MRVCLARSVEREPARRHVCVAPPSYQLTVHIPRSALHSSVGSPDSGFVDRIGAERNVGQGGGGGKGFRGAGTECRSVTRRDRPKIHRREIVKRPGDGGV